MTGIFTISLDFELHWGVFDKRDRLARKQCYENTLQLIPRMLDLFAKHDVHVTWATVGSLFAKNSEEWLSLKPAVEPAYENDVYSAYKWAKKNSLSNQYHWAHFAPESIAAILKYPGQELATHTFSHYYCMEPQTNPEAFAEDLRAAQNAAKKFGTEMVSLVFPRNQYNPEYLKTCYEAGIKAIRSNPNNWFWTPIPNEGTSLMRKVFRTGDGYMQMGRRTSYSLSSIGLKPDEPIQLPASRLFRSWHPKYAFSNTLRLRRILGELKTAAVKKECYHLWWHPENFGDFPEQNLQDLETVLKAYSHYKKQYGMQSWNMGEYVTGLNQEKNQLSGQTNVILSQNIDALIK
jgi:peptidoglycan/xylan/chitin deacetylase (PgdA/CDA1 family)